MECFRCYDMKVVDPVVLDSIKEILGECYGAINSVGDHHDESLLERINSHIVLLEAMPDD